MHCDHSLIYCAFPIWVLIVPDSSTRALWQQREERPNSEEGRNMARNFRAFYLQVYFHTRRVLYHAVKSYDMGPTALLPLPPKKVVLKIFIVLGRVWTRETWGPIASTISTRPPRPTALTVHWPCFEGTMYIPIPFWMLLLVMAGSVGDADCAASVNQVPSCHELRLDKSRTEVWTNWPLPLLALLFLHFLSVSQIRSNSVFLFKDRRDLSVSMLPVSAWRLDLSRQIASFSAGQIKERREWM
jgi:hypothetical protein